MHVCNESVFMTHPDDKSGPFDIDLFLPKKSEL